MSQEDGEVRIVKHPYEIQEKKVYMYQPIPEEQPQTVQSSCQDTERAPDPFLREPQRPPGRRENLSYQDDPFGRRTEYQIH